MAVKVKVAQQLHPDWLGPRTPNVDNYVYLVERTTNTVRVTIGQTLTKAEIQELIADDITVEIS